MNQLAGFFKERHTVVGVFYPLHYMIAVFPSLNVAQAVLETLKSAGFAADDVLAVEGREFVAMEDDETGVGAFFMQELSRFAATEQVSTDQNLELAAGGAALVIVHCPSDETKHRAWAVIQVQAPLAAHYYARMGVDHLAESYRTSF
jgi:hypothetical protein